MSQDINYALISALYNSKTGGLYSDVYFPIIKYTIVQLFKQKESSDVAPYYKADDVQDFIWNRFKIKIPVIVIAKSLQKIDNVNPGFVDLTLMENGNSFQIKKLWDSHEFDELSGREEHFNESLKQIEEDYKLFLERNGTFDDKVSYLQFIADNTEEVLGYFQNSDTKQIDEKYTTIIFFLDYLSSNPAKKDEFNIANQLFWASIIAGFLKSDKPLVTAAMDGGMKEYFLDTSILLGIMGLSSKQKEEYTSEVREIIKASQGIMRVHPMTLMEIKTILSSVEAAAQPDPGTDIAEAWENHKLNINKIAKIRLGLEKILLDLDVQVFPLMGPDECKRKANAYAGKKTVFELAAERSSKKTKSYSQDYFREIHDLFMDDYIKERRKIKNESEDIVFVTSNRDLISFTKRMHPEQCYMMSTGRLILDLWMHNVKSVDISSCALTETMARCLDQHNVRVRNKIIEVSKFYNENKGDFDAQVYQEFIKKLYQRAKNVIITVETNPDNQDTLGELTGQRILDAVKADQEYYDRQMSKTVAENAELSSLLSEESHTKEELSKANQEHKSRIENLQREKKELEGQYTKTKEQLIETEKKVKEEMGAREKAEGKIELYGRRDELIKELKQIDADLAPLELAREKSFRNWKPLVLMIIGILIILGAIIIFGIGICKQHWLIAAGALPGALGIFLCTRSCTLRDRTIERRKAAFEEWEQKPENKKFKLLNGRKMALKSEMEEIENMLK
jgi:F0F1-type ATP synthase membrane subunit b/b'